MAMPFHVEKTGNGSKLSKAALEAGELWNRSEEGAHQLLSIG
jgi:hypothetical protein